ncbi:hypothetical protein PGT21_004674 [Puccinia graminis f. sp. tritici]|uniref:RING-type domain-containing protein n=1 Tax=Puccinia graminis f. sp. tritici TaxID=56615 RepID=A0A5B0QTI8_PUCGR|nr:hypothetical protein PGT21_004674 [Puccinia graminis f. sp. tritici]
MSLLRNRDSYYDNRGLCTSLTYSYCNTNGKKPSQLDTSKRYSSIYISLCDLDSTNCNPLRVFFNSFSYLASLSFLEEMRLISSVVATMIFQVIVETSTIHAVNQITSLGENALLKSSIQLKKRMVGDSSPEICAICQDDLIENKKKWENCKHLYHDYCIEKWKNYGQGTYAQCPVCKTFDPKVVASAQNYGLGGEASSSGGSSFSIIRCEEPMCDSGYMKKLPGPHIPRGVIYRCPKCHCTVSVGPGGRRVVL